MPTFAGVTGKRNISYKVLSVSCELCALSVSFAVKTNLTESMFSMANQYFLIPVWRKAFMKKWTIQNSEY
ncbi:MAG: hypothetical protein R2941_05545 [Desulfobacterales bacterium]